MAEDSSNVGLVVLGAGGVGKSAFTIMYIQQTFVSYYDPTIMDNYLRQTEVDGETCTLDIVDTAGQSEFASTRDPYIRKGEGFLIMYSVTDRNTLQEVAQFREQVQRVKDVTAFPCVLVGNKCDLPRQVENDEGESFANNFFEKNGGSHDVEVDMFGSGVPFLEGSAKDGINVDNAYEILVREVWRHRDIAAGRLAQGTPHRGPNAPAAPAEQAGGGAAGEGSEDEQPRRRNKKKKKPCAML